MRGHMSRDNREDTDDKQESPMSEELVALVRSRIEHRYYDEPRVVDAMARAMMPSFGRGDHSPERGNGIHRVAPGAYPRS